jgi:hypothetical protein
MPIGVFQLEVQGPVVPGRAPTATAEAIGLRALLFVLRNFPGAVREGFPQRLGLAAFTRSSPADVINVSHGIEYCNTLIIKITYRPIG